LIILKLFGGLGNQMFQYAFGKKMALLNNTTLKFDLSLFQEEISYRKYELNHFEIQPQIATTQEIELLLSKEQSLFHKLKKKTFNAKSYYIHEDSLEFDKRNFHLKKDAYIDGYWQSENYFIDSALQIRKDFQFAEESDASNLAFLSVIDSDNSISIHIRRGDYVQDDAINQVHGTCSLSYYENAIQFMAGKISSPVFYIFSDDIMWTQQNLSIGYAHHFVDINNQSSAFKDMNLMSHCKHHIIANSSFSWWGAWLNPREDKIVIAPKKWFKNEELNSKTKNITPANWIKL